MEINSDDGPAIDAASGLQLATFLPYRLSVLSNTISRAIAEMYQREFGLTIWQWRVMAVLGETPGMTARDVTRRTAMDKVAVSRAVAGLEKAGHVTRRSDSDDGRASRLTLTAAGRDVYARIAPLALDYERNLLSGLSQRDISTLSNLLDKLGKATTPESPLW